MYEGRNRELVDADEAGGPTTRLAFAAEIHDVLRRVDIVVAQAAGRRNGFRAHVLPEPKEDRAMDEASLRRLADRIEITELLSRYADIVDRRDWPHMDRVFALEATIDFRPSGGPQGPFREMIAWLDRALDSWPNNLHMITNVIVELDGDRARARCYFHVPISRDAQDGRQVTLTESGRFLDRLIRTADGWRIIERVCEEVVREGRLPEGYRIPR